MRGEEARALLRKHALPSKEVSRRVLSAVANGELDRCFDLMPEQKVRIAKLERAYREKLAELGSSAVPRNFPFYLLLQEKYPGSGIREVDHQLQIECYFQGIKPNLLSLLLDLVPQNGIRSSARASRLTEKNQCTALPDACAKVFEREGCAPVTGRNLARFLDWIDKGRSGEPLTVVAPVCPDYASEQDESGIRRYTFKGINNDIGLAAMRIYASLPAVYTLFSQRLGLHDITHIVCLGDCDRFSEENAKRMGITVPDFVQKVQESCTALTEQAPTTAKSCLFSDLCGGELGLREELTKMRKRLGSSEFKWLLESAVIREIAHDRRSLFRRWLGTKKLEDTFLYALVLSQGVEYALMGRMAELKYRNPLILAAGDPRWTVFYRAAASIPVLYLGAAHI